MAFREVKALSAADLFEESLEAISAIGSEGYFVMVNHSRKGPEFIQSSYPQEWQTEYDENSYHLKDPAFLWSLAKNGSRRWSEIKLPDPSGVMKKARRFGLIYGAIFSKGFLTKKSVFSVARDDRELTDDEISFLAGWFERYVTACNRKQAFSIKELDVLQCLANDMTVDEAAENLNISASAAKARLKTARDRYGVKTNSWLVASALRSNQID